jgi:hypothetical protein
MEHQQNNESFTIYTANCCGERFNTSYPNKAVISCASDLKEAVAYDHVGARYGIGFSLKDKSKKNPIQFHRANKDFKESNCLMLDCDNTETDDADKWVYPSKIAEDFPEVAHYIVISRNHMKKKGSKSPRPKFHVYFPIGIMIDVKAYMAFKKAIVSAYPYFDYKAKDGARYFFGNPSAEVTFVAGSTNLTSFAREHNIFPTAESGNTPNAQFLDRAIIAEGSRNNTLSHYAGQVLKRHGDTQKARELFDKKATHCIPPLDKSELDAIFQSAQGFLHNTIE